MKSFIIGRLDLLVKLRVLNLIRFTIQTTCCLMLQEILEEVILLESP